MYWIQTFIWWGTMEWLALWIWKPINLWKVCTIDNRLWIHKNKIEIKVLVHIMYPELLRKLSTNRKNGLHAKSEKNSDKPLEHVHLWDRIGQEISEWKFGVVPLPKKKNEKLWKILPWILWPNFFKLFCSYFGHWDNFIFSFWNGFTFIRIYSLIYSSFFRLPKTSEGIACSSNIFLLFFATGSPSSLGSLASSSLSLCSCKNIIIVEKLWIVNFVNYSQFIINQFTKIIGIIGIIILVTLFLKKKK